MIKTYTIFVVSGTHPVEGFPLGKPVAEALAAGLSKKYNVELIFVPLSVQERIRSQSIGNDRRGKRSFIYAKTKRFNPENPYHILIDIHQVTINNEELGYVKGEYKTVNKNIGPAIKKSIRQGTYGMYFADIPNPPDFRNIWRFRRCPISALPYRKSNILRIEIPVVNDKNDVDLIRTKQHYSVITNTPSRRSWKKIVANALARIIIQKLNLP